MEARHFFMVEVALRSAAGLRPDPIPGPLKTFPRYAGQSVGLLRTPSARASLLPCSAREGLQGAAPFPSRRGRGLRLKPCKPGRASVSRQPERPAVVPSGARACPSPSARRSCSSLCPAVLASAALRLRPCSGQSQVSAIRFGRIAPAGKGPLVSGPLPATLSPQPANERPVS